MATTKTILSTAASLAASAVLIRTVANEFIPHPIKDYIFSSAFGSLTRFSSKLTIIVHEFNGIVPNEMYRAAETYLGSKISPHTLCLQVAKQRDSEAMEVTMEQGETVVDLFQGIEFKWKLRSHEKEKSISVHSRNNGAAMNLVLETKFFVLSCHKKHKDRALAAYLPHILQQFKMIKQEEKPIRIYTGNYDNLYYGNMRDAWNGVKLDHPATFETLAMDPEQKRMVKEDLERFVRRKEYYRRVGKAWKRGYLLYGPPGTGKSSLIAAIANFLKFDVYDIELTEVRSNSALRILLLGTANRSIIVIEDIDCTIDLRGRKEMDDARESRGQKNHLADDKVTLSGLLNFIDGLWSSCGDERIIIFTTNHKERVDSALLRPGRMDVHIHMSYCCPSAFRTLLSNYHNVEDHPLEPEVQRLLLEVEATPAEVAEELLKSDDCDDAMLSLVKFLHGKKAEASEAAEKEESTVMEGSEAGEVNLLLE